MEATEAHFFLRKWKFTGLVILKIEPYFLERKWASVASVDVRPVRYVPQSSIYQ